MGLKSWAKRKAMSKIIAVAITYVAEGKLGSGPKRFYWWAKGKKTWTGAILGVVYGALHVAQANGLCASAGWDCGEWSALLGTASAFLLTVGLVDGTLHAAPPVKMGL
jgi:hypothetical protein